MLWILLMPPTIHILKSILCVRPCKFMAIELDLVGLRKVLFSNWAYIDMELVIFGPNNINWSNMFSASRKDPCALVTTNFIASFSFLIPSWAAILVNLSMTSVSLSLGKKNFWHLDDKDEYTSIVSSTCYPWKFVPRFCTNWFTLFKDKYLESWCCLQR